MTLPLGLWIADLCLSFGVGLLLGIGLTQLWSAFRN